MAYNPAVQGMGISNTGIGDPNVIFKRQNRWLLEINGNGVNSFRVPPHFVKLASRPSITFDETEIHFLNDKMYIPGKATWEPITITITDVAGNLSGDAGNANIALYQWLVNVFDFTKPTRKFMNSKRSEYAGEVTLNLYDGCGGMLETWVIGDAWPQSVSFGNLDMSSSEVVDIELTLRYSQVTFTHHCPSASLFGNCVPC